MPDVTFEYGKAKITVREQTGRDVLRLSALQGELQIACAESVKPKEITVWDRVECNKFARLMLRSTVNGKLDFPWPDYETCTGQELYAALIMVMNSPPELPQKWLNALEEADLEVPDPEELPGAEKSSKKSTPE